MEDTIGRLIIDKKILRQDISESTMQISDIKHIAIDLIETALCASAELSLIYQSKDLEIAIEKLFKVKSDIATRIDDPEEPLIYRIDDYRIVSDDGIAVTFGIEDLIPE